MEVYLNKYHKLEKELRSSKTVTHIGREAIMDEVSVPFIKIKMKSNPNTVKTRRDDHGDRSGRDDHDCG